MKKLREQHGLSLRRVELKSGVSHSYLSQLENSGKIPSARVLLKIAPVYKVDAAVLFEKAGLMPDGEKTRDKNDNIGDYDKTLPPGLKELIEDMALMKMFNISSFEITRITELNFRKRTKISKDKFLLLILFLRQIDA